MLREGSRGGLQCFIVLNNTFAERWATYHSWTALSPIWGLKHTSVNSRARENSFKIRKAGTGTAFPIMLCNYSDLLPRPGPLVGRKRMWMLANFRSCPQCPGKLPNWHLFVSRASLTAWKAAAAGCIIDWAVQLCPSSDLQTIHFLFYCISAPPCDGFDHDLGDGRAVLITVASLRKGRVTSCQRPCPRWAFSTPDRKVCAPLPSHSSSSFLQTQL